LGLFISGLASLPRIVTVHDVSIAPVVVKNLPSKSGKDEVPIANDDMVMDATVKTYHEGQSGEAAAVTDSKKKRGNSKGGKP
jgi:type IV pilus assembly protein PilO